MYHFTLVDPFDGVVVWGTAGLLAWSGVAAAVGIGLRALTASRRRPAVQVPAPASAPAEQHDVPDAA